MKLFKRIDILIISILLIISAIIGFIYYRKNDNKDTYALIYYKNEIIKEIDLSEKKNYIFSVPQARNIVFHVYEDGSICFEESECPDHICINTGRISMPGQSAACLPNKIVLKIVSKDKYNPKNPDIILS